MECFETWIFALDLHLVLYEITTSFYDSLNAHEKANAVRVAVSHVPQPAIIDLAEWLQNQAINQQFESKNIRDCRAVAPSYFYCDDKKKILHTPNETSKLSLREKLRRYRIAKSFSLGKPAYTVFSNTTMDEICTTLPRTKIELLAVKGIGKSRLEHFGDDILDIVRKHAPRSGGTNK